MVACMPAVASITKAYQNNGIYHISVAASMHGANGKTGTIIHECQSAGEYKACNKQWQDGLYRSHTCL